MTLSRHTSHRIAAGSDLRRGFLYVLTTYLCTTTPNDFISYDSCQLDVIKLQWRAGRRTGSVYGENGKLVLTRLSLRLKGTGVRAQVR